MKIYIRLFDEDGNKYDLFSGPATDCPPLPRENELLDAGQFKGRVMEIEHDYAQDPDKVFISIRISNL